LDKTTESLLAELGSAIERGNAKQVEDIIFELGQIRTFQNQVLDEIVEQLLMLLESESMYSSPLATHLLNFFEFESRAH
jgi:hypothetical protein